MYISKESRMSCAYLSSSKAAVRFSSVARSAHTARPRVLAACGMVAQCSSRALVPVGRVLVDHCKPHCQLCLSLVAEAGVSVKACLCSCLPRMASAARARSACCFACAIYVQGRCQLRGIGVLGFFPGPFAVNECARQLCADDV